MLRRWQDGARFEEFMARHAEESRDELQAMKALNVFYQVRLISFSFQRSICLCIVLFAKTSTLTKNCGQFGSKLH